MTHAVSIREAAGKVPANAQIQGSLDEKRYNNFDVLRFLLAVAVIFSHSFELLGRPEPVKQITSGQVNLGWLAVDGFFVISGFLVAQSFLASSSVWRYLLKRVLRIYPGFMAAGIVCMCVVGPVGMDFSRDYWIYCQWGVFFGRMPALLPYWIPQTFKTGFWPFVDAPVWTIQYEFMCYLLIAAVGLTGLLRRRWWVAGLFVAVYVLYVLQTYWRVYLYNWQEFLIFGAPDNYPRFVTSFLAGTVCLAFRGYLPTGRPGLALATAALAVIAGVGWYGTGLHAVLPWMLPLVIFGVAFAGPLVPLQHWGKYGDFSYGIYLYGWPVQQVSIHYGKPWLSPWSLFVLATAGTIVVAIASWFGVERVFMQMKSWGARRQIRKAPRPA